MDNLLKSFPPQELRFNDGRVFAVVMSPDKFARIQGELAALRAEVERFRAATTGSEEAAAIIVEAEQRER